MRDPRRSAFRFTLPRLAAVLFIFTAIPLYVAACNTTEGVGEDISAAGDALDDAAEDAQD